MSRAGPTGDGEVAVHGLPTLTASEVVSGKGSDTTVTIEHAAPVGRCRVTRISTPARFACSAERRGAGRGQPALRRAQLLGGPASRAFSSTAVRYPLHGVSRHQDRKGLGNAITREMHDEDMALHPASWARTPIRLAHYQHDQYFYDLVRRSRHGRLGRDPLHFSEHMPNGRENTISQMKELIVQNYNHRLHRLLGRLQRDHHQHQGQPRHAATTIMC